MKEKGIISKVSDHDGRFGININDTWYNGFGESPVKVGDLVEFEYVENESKDKTMVFKNVNPNDIEVVEEATQTETPQPKPRPQIGLIDAKSRRRTDCLLKAVDMHMGGHITQDRIETVADRLVKYCENQ